MLPIDTRLYVIQLRVKYPNKLTIWFITLYAMLYKQEDVR